MLLETSRGCWWGEKHHCTFCGLNQLSMAYRAKSAHRVVGELRRLAARHGILDIDAVDSIMDMRYLSTMCRDLADQHWDLRLFYEVKANLSREQLRSLKHAGIRRIQPGVESLSTHVLTLMRKGSTLLTNVRLLKWARYYDLQVDWNLLFGFPGETDADYEAQLDLLPSLTHLAPPAGVGQLWLERFSPYFTENHGFTDIRPLDVYGEVYPVPGVDLAELAYFFDYKVDGICSALVRDTLAAAVEQWRRRWIEGRVPLLRYERGPDWLSIVDTRGAEPRQVTLRDWYADAYLACDDKPRTPAAIRAALGERVQEEELAAFLATCMTNRLMVGEDGRYLSLALPKNPNW
jgi:ribosomal peptide maturation radical SAM protein 1